MGTVCCCFNTRGDPEDDVSNTRPNCFCPNCIIHALLNNYTAIFNKEQSDAALTSTAQVAADPLSSDAAASNNIQSNINAVTSSPRTLRFDVAADATHTGSGQKQDGQITEHDDSKGNKSSGPQCELTARCSSSSQPKFSSVAEYEEEDVCPTCLEEYIPEHPKTVLKCSHAYHLSCIYEWMERSEKCPICDRMMIFDEET